MFHDLSPRNRVHQNKVIFIQETNRLDKMQTVVVVFFFKQIVWLANEEWKSTKNPVGTRVVENSCWHFVKVTILVLLKQSVKKCIGNPFLWFRKVWLFYYWTIWVRVGVILDLDFFDERFQLVFDWLNSQKG